MRAFRNINRKRYTFVNVAKFDEKEEKKEAKNRTRDAIEILFAFSFLRVTLNVALKELKKKDIL